MLQFFSSSLKKQKRNRGSCAGNLLNLLQAQGNVIKIMGPARHLSLPSGHPLAQGRRERAALYCGVCSGWSLSLSLSLPIHNIDPVNAVSELYLHAMYTGIHTLAHRPCFIHPRVLQ